MTVTATSSGRVILDKLMNDLYKEFVDTGTHKSAVTVSRAEYWEIWHELESSNRAMYRCKDGDRDCLGIYGAGGLVKIVHD